MYIRVCYEITSEFRDLSKLQMNYLNRGVCQIGIAVRCVLLQVLQGAACKMYVEL